MSNLVAVESLFRFIPAGRGLTLRSLTIDENGVAYVSRSKYNNGVVARVAPVDGVEPFAGGLLTVACGGNAMETFLQPEPFYCGSDVKVLAPLREMTTREKLYYCACLRANAYRYTFGRQANRTLGKLLVPALPVSV